MKICILSEYAFTKLIKNKDLETAGAELQMTILAEELANRSYDVSFVTLNNLGKRFQIYNGIKVYNPFYIGYKGYPYFFPHNIYRLFKTLKKINADIYIQRATTPLTGLVAFYAKLTKKTFLYSSASENDVSYFLDIKNIRDFKKIFFKYGVKNSNYVLCQTNNQKKLLKKAIGKDGLVFKNLYPLNNKIKNQKNEYKPIALWVGRIKELKQPELFIKLAKEIPEYEFWMIGGPTLDVEYFNKIKKEANKLKNFRFIGSVNHNKINGYYEKSSILINTSTKEGFPNTYLEAWGNFVPVVTLNFDPDEIICKKKLGFHSKTFDQLVKDTRTLLQNQDLCFEMGKNGRRYVEEEHGINAILKKYVKLFKAIT